MDIRFRFSRFINSYILEIFVCRYSALCCSHSSHEIYYMLIKQISNAIKMYVLIETRIVISARVLHNVKPVWDSSKFLRSITGIRSEIFCPNIEARSEQWVTSTWHTYEITIFLCDCQDWKHIAQVECINLGHIEYFKNWPNFSFWVFFEGMKRSDSFSFLGPIWGDIDAHRDAFENLFI